MQSALSPHISETSGKFVICSVTHTESSANQTSSKVEPLANITPGSQCDPCLQGLDINLKTMFLSAIVMCLLLAVLL